MIGHMSNTIKSNERPEANMLKRYLRSVDVRTAGIAMPSELNSDDDADGSANKWSPLIDASAINSSTDAHHVTWPKLTAKCSRLVSNGAFAPLGDDHDRARRIVPILGPTLGALHMHKRCTYTLREVDQKVQVGRWRYNIQVKEERMKVHKSRSSWFRIRWEHVPHHAESERRRRAQPGAVVLQESEYLYGRIVRFAEMTLPFWGDEGTTYRLAQVSLFEADGAADLVTGLVRIDCTKPLEYSRRGQVQFVQAHHLDSCIAVAPVGLEPPASLIMCILPIEL